MQAVQFNATIPRYLTGRALGALTAEALWGRIACTRLREVPEPALPGPDFVKIRTRYGGICGSDLNVIRLRSSPFYSALFSFPYTFGHECLGTVAEAGTEAGDFRPGERVVVDPLLTCVPRGLEPCRYCSRGETNLCERTTEGRLAPGSTIGYCRDTGGSWGEAFVAHRTQLYRVPEAMTDDNAFMVEPLACGLHPVLQNPPADDETVLIVGAGTIGLCVLAALRALGCGARIVVIARHPHQAEAARKLQASEVVSGRSRPELYRLVSEWTGARLLQPIIGKPVVVGGVDRCFECVGSDSAIDDALRLTRGGGQVVLVGMPGPVRSVDWSSIFVQELDVRAAFTYHRAERFQGRTWTTFELALDLLSQGKVDLGWMVTHRFPLRDYKRALRMLRRRARHGILKAVFDFGAG